MVGTPSGSDTDLQQQCWRLPASRRSCYEVVWTRVLAMVVGPSIYAFAATLTSFITGLALGSFAGAVSRRTQPSPGGHARADVDRHRGGGVRERRLVGSPVLEIGPGASGRTASLAGIALPHLAIAFGLTLPIAFGLGVAFPLSLELAGSRDAIPARRLGVLYAVNTAAAVVGALVAGFVAIPAIGLRASLLVATTSLLLGARSADRPQPSFESRPPCGARSTRGCRRVDGHEPWVGS